MFEGYGAEIPLVPVLGMTMAFGFENVVMLHAPGVGDGVAGVGVGVGVQLAHGVGVGVGEHSASAVSTKTWTFSIAHDSSGPPCHTGPEANHSIVIVLEVCGMETNEGSRPIS